VRGFDVVGRTGETWVEVDECGEGAGESCLRLILCAGLSACSVAFVGFPRARRVFGSGGGLLL